MLLWQFSMIRYGPYKPQSNQNRKQTLQIFALDSRMWNFFQ